jgi:hypothetical protein
MAAGCGGAKKLPTASDAEKDQAKAALLAVLDAWQAGKLSDLKSRTPPITFVDDDVVQGHALVSYELDPLKEIAPHRDVAVDLVLRGRDGRALHRSAIYQVVLSPTLTVLRNDP